MIRRSKSRQKPILTPGAEMLRSWLNERSEKRSQAKIAHPKRRLLNRKGKAAELTKEKTRDGDDKAA